VLARGSQNAHWQWYADQTGATIGSGYLGVLRARRPAVQPKPPTDLPQSRLFRGTGLAMLHTDLLNAKNDIQVFFKSSPMGAQSHGFNSQNSFILVVHGKPVLIWTGRRDWHGSKHHTQWMWETKSQNCILVNGNGQIKHSTEIGGKIAAFHTSREFDYVVGDASKTYGEALSEFTRTIFFAKPDVILIYDRLAAPKPATFTWLLHAQEQMEVGDQTAIAASNGDSHAFVSILEPRGLRLSQNDRFYPQPQDRPTWRQWHLSAETPERQADIQFITVVRPYAGKSKPAESQQARKVSGGWLYEAGTPDGGKLLVLLAAGPAGQEVEAAGVMKTTGQCAAVRLDRAGKVVATFSGGGRASYHGGPKPLVIGRTDTPVSPQSD
ncbi:heparinase II/III family protein, partial [Candidatus Sumerlaeota bacterium]|nr:heparinase II/III family protein [Candidatus Sumerlaeota bacterium]